MSKRFAYPVLLALSLMVILSGCRQEPLPVAGNAIRFSVSPAVVDVETKADPPSVADDLIKNGKSVLLYGSLLSSGASGSTPVFSATALTCSKPDGGAASWSYTSATVPTRYWEQGGTYDFRAVSNASKENVSYTNNTLTVVYSGTDDYDLMVASAPGEPAKTSSDPVQLKFRHACAAVRFCFKREAPVGTPDYSYVIKSFKVTNIFRAGTLNYKGASASGEVTYDGNDSEWSYSGDRIDSYSWPAESGTTWPVPTEFAAITDRDWYFVVPQTLQSGASVQFTYGLDPGQTLSAVSLPLDTYENAQVSWAPGKIYTYNITIRPDYIRLSVGVDDWEDGNEWSLNE